MKIIFDYKIFYQQKVGGISNYFFNLGKELQPLNRADKLKMTKKNLKNLKTLMIFNCLA